MSQEQERAYVRALLKGYAHLEEERIQRVRQSNTPRDLPAFNGLVLAALKRFPPAPTSGLIEQQRLFKIAHERAEAERERGS